MRSVLQTKVICCLIQRWYEGLWRWLREQSLLVQCWQMKEAKHDAISSLLSYGSSPWHILSPKPFPRIVSEHEVAWAKAKMGSVSNANQHWTGQPSSYLHFSFQKQPGAPPRYQ